MPEMPRDWAEALMRQADLLLPKPGEIRRRATVRRRRRQSAITGCLAASVLCAVPLTEALRDDRPAVVLQPAASPTTPSEDAVAPLPGTVLGTPEEAHTDFATRSPEPGIAVGCYETPDVRAGTAAVLYARAESPLSACAREWDAGVLSDGSGQRPPLLTCAVEGGAAVFPTGDVSFCSSAGLREWDEGGAASQAPDG